MQKQYTWLLGLLFVMSGLYASAGAESLGYDDLLYSSALHNPLLSPPKTLGEALRSGFMQAIPRGASRAIGVALESGMSRVSSLTNTVKRGVLHVIYGNRGFDIRELCTWEIMIKTDVATVLNFAKGARVVRAHVVTQDQPDASSTNGNTSTSKPTEHQQIFQSVTAFKNNIKYIVAKLNEYEPYYSVQPDKTGRSWLNLALDALAVGSVAYVVGDAFTHTPTEQEAAKKVQDVQKILIDQQTAEKKQTRILSDNSQSPTTLPTPTAPGDSAHAPWIAHQETFKAALIEHLGQSVAQFASINTTHERTKSLIKTGLCIFAAVRLVQWLRSKDALGIANALSDVNRDLIVHLVGSVRDNLNYLISLCDSVKQESDLVRIKDDIEFISKNCGDALVQIAYLIDQAEALTIQRLSKPGQSSSLGQGLGGLGSMLPKL